MKMHVGLLLREKPVRLLLALRQSVEPCTISGLAKASEMSFVHASHLISALSAAGLVAVSRSGRKKQVSLTHKGADVSAALEAVVSRLSEKASTPAQEQSAQTQPPGAFSETLAFPEPPPQQQPSE